jgi:hypothetical protein
MNTEVRSWWGETPGEPCFHEHETARGDARPTSRNLRHNSASVLIGVHPWLKKGLYANTN